MSAGRGSHAPKGSPEDGHAAGPLPCACTALAVSRMTFWRHWQTVFTDPRNPNHGQTVGRKVFEDELVVAVENGGGDRAKAAVLALRKQLGRV